VKVIGYLRVSTEGQADKYGLSAQREEIERWCAAHDHELISVLHDVVSSGRTDRMYGRQIAVAALGNGVADALVVRALDRATRSTADGAALLEMAKRQGWRLMALDGTDTSDPEQELTINVRIAMAQEERRRISQRVREGMASAKRQGKQFGRPRSVPDDVTRNIVTLRRSGLSAQAIAKALDASGVPTPSGGRRWHHSVVRDVIRREGVA